MDPTKLYPIPPMENSTFAMLPSRIVEENGGCNDDCTICITPMKAGDTVCDLPICGHTFHLSCISHWFVVKLRTGAVGCCPLCNTTTVIPCTEFPTVIAIQTPVEPHSMDQSWYITRHRKTIVGIILGIWCTCIIMIITLG
jgi:hypothetical protein